MTRQEAHQLVKEMLQNQNLVKHCLAVEAIMRALAVKLREMHPELPESEFDEEEWGVVGLLHDADYEVTNKDLETHTDVIVQKIRESDKSENSERIAQGILAHHALKKPNRENYLEKAIFAADELSGLITATALVRPDKKLSQVTTESVMKKYKQPAFAAGAHRHQIILCETELNIPLEEFVAIALKAMQGIADDLGL
jgi:predicted hydrolase (HD superfamily)